MAAAINGYFFYPETGTPMQGQIHSGWYAKRFDNNQTGTGGSGFAWQMDREAFIGECVTHNTSRQLVTFEDGFTYPIHNINTARGSDELILYTPQYDYKTPPDTSGTDIEVLVEMTKPDLLVPQTNRVLGRVKDIKSGRQTGGSIIPFDYTVLSASGSAATFLKNHVAEGDIIGISQEIARCNTSYPKIDWTKTYASIGGSFFFLKDGVINAFSSDGQAANRAPRTAIAYNERYIFFIVVDGRNPGVSEGMSIGELAVFARDRLGARWGIAQDGGGSSTLVINGAVVNNTYCNHIDCRENSSGSEKTNSEDLSSEGFGAAWDETGQTVQRLVANGMMMVVVEPARKSTSYLPDEFLTTTSPLDLRTGPGENYPILTTIPAHTEGVVLSPDNDLTGVLATGSFWWKLKFGPVQGWAALERYFPNPTFLPFLSRQALLLQERSFAGLLPVRLHK